MSCNFPICVCLKMMREILFFSGFSQYFAVLCPVIVWQPTEFWPAVPFAKLFLSWRKRSQCEVWRRSPDLFSDCYPAGIRASSKRKKQKQKKKLQRGWWTSASATTDHRLKRRAASVSYLPCHVTKRSVYCHCPRAVARGDLSKGGPTRTTRPAGGCRTTLKMLFILFYMFYICT